MNRKNLLLLADYLEALPEDYSHFEMHEFNLDGDPVDIRGSHCNTAACAVGHAPYVEGLPQPEPYESWTKYGNRIFGLEPDSIEWDWCFDGLWARSDNTPKGAAKRIWHLIDYGVPENWIEQLYGESR